MRVSLAVAVLLLTATVTLPAEKATRNVEVPLPAGEKVVVSEINGPVEITASPDSRVRIEFVRIAKGSLPSNGLQVQQLASALRVRSSDFKRYPERVRNVVRIQLPKGTELELTAIRGEVSIDADLAQVRGSDIRGSLRSRRTARVQAKAVGGAASIADAQEVDLQDVNGSVSVVTGEDGASVNVDGKETTPVGRARGHVSVRNVSGSVRVTTPNGDEK